MNGSHLRALSVTGPADLSARLPFQLKLFPARLDSKATTTTTATIAASTMTATCPEYERGNTLEQNNNDNNTCVAAIAITYRMPHGGTAHTKTFRNPFISSSRQPSRPVPTVVSRAVVCPYTHTHTHGLHQNCENAQTVSVQLSDRWLMRSVGTPTTPPLPFLPPSRSEV